MKSTFLSIALISVLISCNNGQNKSVIQDNTEAQRLKALEQSRIDSLERVQIDSLALIAWGDANFGMTFKEVSKTKIFKDASNYSDKNNPFQHLSLYSSQTNIEGISKIDASFFNDILYRIDLETYEKNANYYDTDIKETVILLKTLIESKYGTPTYANGFPSFLEMRPNKGITAYHWKIGEKHIFITVKEVYSGSQYMMSCSIYNDKVYEPVEEYYRKEKEKEEATKVNGF